MRIVRKGKVGGLDIDYSVFVDSVDDVQTLHETLISKGFLFMYQKGDIPFDPHVKSMYVLHYLDEQLKLYDYAIFFPETKQEPKKVKAVESNLDTAYKRATKDETFRKNLMAYMKFHKLLTAFRKHLKAYGHLEPEYTERFSKILANIRKTTKLELEKTPTNESLRGLDIRLKHFFGV
jgi:hypothetical protein